jgi:hypothetical protein
LDRVGHRVYAVVNYDNFSILPELVGPYTDMVKAVVDRYYTGVTRYTTSAFLRMKIGDALKERKWRRTSMKAGKRRSRPQRTGMPSTPDRCQ